MDTRLLCMLPTEQARCRDIARHYTAMGSIGCFAAALIEQALRRADRAIIEGGEDAIRGVLGELRAYGLTRNAPGQPCAPGRPTAVKLQAALDVPPVGRRVGRLAQVAA